MMEFKKMAVLLVEEEQHLLQALRQEEEDTAVRLQQSMAALEHQSCSLETLLLQLEDRSKQEPLQMLRVRSTCSTDFGVEGAQALAGCGWPAGANRHQQGRLCLCQLQAA